MKRSAILLGVKTVDIARLVARGQNLNDIGESGRYCDSIAVVLDPETLYFAFKISERDLMLFLEKLECGLKVLAAVSRLQLSRVICAESERV
jgi:hypothetical protein